MILDTPAILALAMQCSPQVAPSTMLAIIATESAGNPYAIGVNSGARLIRQPRTRQEAIATSRDLLAGGHNIDMGLGQINSANLHALGLSLEGVFDPCTNISAAARILTENYRRATASGAAAPLGAALSAYNTGSMSRGFANGYVARVVRAAAVRFPPIDEDFADSGAVQPALEAETPPPLWDVFAYYRWSQHQAADMPERETLYE